MGQDTSKIDRPKLREKIARIICCFAKNNNSCAECKENTPTSPFPDCFPDIREETDQLLSLISKEFTMGEEAEPNPSPNPSRYGQEKEMNEGFLTANDSSWVARHMVESMDCQLFEQLRPSVLFQPRVFKDGDKWCCLRDENLMEGVVGFGDTPNEATLEFDKEWGS